MHKDGRTFFIDHNNKRTTWEDPRLSDPNVSGPAMPYSRDYKWKYDYLKNQLRRPTHIPKQFKMKARSLTRITLYGFLPKIKRIYALVFNAGEEETHL